MSKDTKGWMYFLIGLVIFTIFALIIDPEEAGKFIFFTIAIFICWISMVGLETHQEKTNPHSSEKTTDVQAENRKNGKVASADYFNMKTKILEYVASGNKYPKICEFFEEDFKYIFGDDWKDKLKIPNRPHMYELINDTSGYGFSHYNWVVLLCLATKGKADFGLFNGSGSVDWVKGRQNQDTYEIGMSDYETSTRFAKRCEYRFSQSKIGYMNIKIMNGYDWSAGYVRDSGRFCADTTGEFNNRRLAGVLFVTEKPDYYDKSKRNSESNNKK